MDTMEITKVAGGVCGALLILLLLKWGSEIIYHGSHDKTDLAYYLEIETNEVEVKQIDIAKNNFIYQKETKDLKKEVIARITGTDFFATLPKFPSADELINMVKKFTGGKFSINTSPLRGDHENSGKYKKVHTKLAICGISSKGRMCV